ncbi:hypothetical protein D3C85_1396840 [compost metagenome]
MVLHHRLVGIAQPVTDHLDVHGRDFHGAAWAYGGGLGLGVQDHGAIGYFVDQATADQQGLQGLLRRQVAGNGRRLLAGDQVRAEEQLQ